MQAGNKIMTDSCGCAHCHCDDDQEKAPKEKVKKLEKDIEELGFKIEETPEGEIKISE
jgi:hypothetical protein